MIEEDAIKSRLFYDGHNNSEDRKLYNIQKYITKLCLGKQESDAETNKTYEILDRELSSAIASSQINKKTISMWDGAFGTMAERITAQQNLLEENHQSISRLKLDMEYAEKMREINKYPNSQGTQEAIENLKNYRHSLMDKMAGQRKIIDELIGTLHQLKSILERSH